LSRKKEALSVAAQVKNALDSYNKIVLRLTLASWCIYLLVRRPDTRPVFDKSDQFRDLTNYIGKTAHLYHNAAGLGSGFPIFNYPPSAAFLWKALLHSFSAHPVLPYMVLVGLLTAALAMVGWRASGGQPEVRAAFRIAIITTATVGYPLLFAIDRANLEGLLWAITGVGLCFLLRQKYSAAAIWIGLSASIKPFSILFILILLGRRKYKEAALGVATAGVIVLAAFIAIGPNPWTAYQQLKPGLAYYNEHYAAAFMPSGEARFAHSILDGMKSVALTAQALSRPLAPADMRAVHPTPVLSEVMRLRAKPGGWHMARDLARIYPYIALAILAWILWRAYRLPMLNQVTAVAIAATLLPPVSGDYTLLQLYVPFGALAVFLTREVSEGQSSFPRKPMMAIAVVYGLLFAPLTFLSIYSGDAKLVLLIALLIIVLRSPMKSRYFDPDMHEVAA
jgi:hypothetical protein